MGWRGSGLGRELGMSTAPARGNELVVLKKLLVMEEGGLLGEEERQVFDAGGQRSSRDLWLSTGTNGARGRRAYRRSVRPVGRRIAMFRFCRGRPTVHEGRPGSSACRIGQWGKSIRASKRVGELINGTNSGLSTKKPRQGVGKWNIQQKKKGRKEERKKFSEGRKSNDTKGPRSPSSRRKRSGVSQEDTRGEKTTRSKVGKNGEVEEAVAVVIYQHMGIDSRVGKRGWRKSLKKGIEA